jgi:preprotein translocase subunit SecG
MLQFIIILIMVVCVLLTLVVLAQNSKGGLATGMGGATQLMGARRTTDTIEKATWVLVGALFVLCLSANVFVGTGEQVVEGISSPNIERAKETAVPEAPAQPAPAQEAPVTPAPQPAQ